MSRTKQAVARLASIANATDLISRSRLAGFLGFSHGGARDLYTAFGYKRILIAEDYYGMYSRNDIAHRIINAYPKATWREAPIIKDEKGNSADKNSKDYSPFVESVEGLIERTNLMRVLERADRLASIGRYGILFLGFDGEDSPSTPISGHRKLLFISPYSESNARVAQWCRDHKDPRFGMPLTYTLTNSSLGTDGQASPGESLTVHWTRVMHIAETLDQDDVFGVPRLMPLFNRLMDLEKVVGGSAETFWLTANRGIAFWADEDANIDDEAIKKVKEQAEELHNGLRRTIVGQKFSAQVLGSESPDPSLNAGVLLDLIAGASGIPKRILLGTERGELASSQDENNWSERIGERRTNFATPSLLKPFVQRMIDTGNVFAPSGKVTIEWPDTNSLGPAASADINSKKALTLATYANSPEAQLIVPIGEFRSKFLDLEPVSEFELPAIEDLPPGLDEPLGGELPQEDPAATENTPPGAANNNLKANMEPKPLYVSRKVQNAKAILAWAKKQGIKDLEPADELHVTVLYSKTPMNWLDVSEPWTGEDDGSLVVLPGGPRVLEAFGHSLVLSFVSDALSWRHRSLKEAGGSHSWPNYQPHITLSKNADQEFLEIEPYTGPILLDIEIFEDIKED